jgi:hypothetical protein
MARSPVLPAFAAHLGALPEFIGVIVAEQCDPGGKRERNRKFVDSPLEGRVTSEPVSEIGFSWAGELPSDSKTFMDVSEA